ncbi:unnamed protein product [Victoria cruziana]
MTGGEPTGHGAGTLLGLRRSFERRNRVRPGSKRCLLRTRGTGMIQKSQNEDFFGMIKLFVDEKVKGQLASMSTSGPKETMSC